jgi:uncharacterized protein (UPF0332 family)
VSDSTRGVRTSPVEIARLLAIADRDLDQASQEVLHLDTRFALAYNAALQLATVVLRLDGVRVRKDAFHARTFAELKERLPEDRRSVAEYFDRARRKRNTAAYEQANVVSAGELNDLIEQVERFRQWVEQALCESRIGKPRDEGCCPDGL